MDDFPLNPFLASLAADGIRPTIGDYERVSLALRAAGPWTLTRFRDMLLALLARNQDQQEVFLRRFDDFFQLDADDAFADVDLERALADLRRLAQARPAPRGPRLAVPRRLRRPGQKAARRSRFKFELWMVLPALLALWALAAAVGYVLRPASPASLLITPTPAAVIATLTQPAGSTGTPVTPQGPTATAETETKARETPQWQRYAALAAFFLGVASLYALYLWRSRQIPQDKTPDWNESGPRHFSPGSIGGQPAPFLDDETLNHLADSMGYFQSEQSGKALNVHSSIEATLRRGGIPTLEFYKRKQMRSLLILEDAFAEATAWNPIASELAGGMRQRGVPVLYGQFSGSPGRFKTEDGSVYHLEDLEDERRGYLLLAFTDGKGLYRRESAFALEALARWPQAAWMELREPRSWDETSTLPTRYGIPIYPATPAGTVRALRRFLTEQGAEPDFSAQALGWQGLPDLADTGIETCVEDVLGDALTWAQDCAMLQPVSPGLADALRREFHPHLPAGRVERLHALPGARRSVSGLRFSDEALKVLRAGFMVRRDEDEQEDVLRFLLREIGRAEPDEEGSLAYLAWESVAERVRLELEQDGDLERLAQLAQTPLGSAIDASLENFGLPGQVDKIPLRLKPKNKHALQRLARVAEGLRIPRLEAYPVARGHWLALGLALVLFLGFAGWSVLSYPGASQVTPPGMVYVSGGTFEMGSNDDGIDYAMQLCSEAGIGCERSLFEDEQLAHTVTLDDFWIDRTEVSNAQYALCVDAGVCEASSYADDATWNADDYPVVGVSWYNARDYCEWAGGRLPTEAEWEYAARGSDGKIYPWGNTFDGARLNFCDANCTYDAWKDASYDDGYETTAPVGSFESGASWCGALDMAGNVWEWTSSLYQGYPYQANDGREDSALSDPRVLRGGACYYRSLYARSAYRYEIIPDLRIDNVGFRCVGSSTSFSP